MNANTNFQIVKKFLKHLIIALLNISLIFSAISCSKDIEPTGPLPAQIALQSDKGLQIGAAVANITPDDPTKVYLEGYTDLVQSTGVHDSITARCLLINDGQTIVAMISLDLLGFFMVNVESMKKMIVNETGLKNENIFIHAIHTHSAPEVLGNYKFNNTYLAKLNRKVTDCVLAAFKTSKKAIALISTGNSQVKTINRRYSYKKPANKFTTIEFKDSAQHTIAMLLNFGCHPVMLGPDNTLMTADYVYYLRKKIESEKGGVALFFNSRFGDINPAPINPLDFYNPYGRTFEMAKNMGEQLALDMLQANLNCDTIPISIKTTTMTISHKLKYFNQTQISILDLGQVQIAMIPGEPLEGFADAIESLLPGPYPMIIGNANDYIGYIVPENEWNTCTRSLHMSTCYEETKCADISIAGILEDGYRELLNK